MGDTSVKKDNSNFVNSFSHGFNEEFDVNKINAIASLLVQDATDGTLKYILEHDDSDISVDVHILSDASPTEPGYMRILLTTSSPTCSLHGFMKSLSKNELYKDTLLHYNVFYRRLVTGDESHKRKAPDSSVATPNAKRVKKEAPPPPPDYGKILRDYDWKTFIAKKSTRPKSLDEFLAVVNIPKEEFVALWAAEDDKKSGRKCEWYTVTKQEYVEDIDSARSINVEDTADDYLD